MGTRFHCTPCQPKNTIVSNSVLLELVYLLRWILLNFPFAPRLSFKFLLCPACGRGVCKNRWQRYSYSLPGMACGTPFLEGSGHKLDRCCGNVEKWITNTSVFSTLQHAASFAGNSGYFGLKGKEYSRLIVEMSHPQPKFGAAVTCQVKWIWRTAHRPKAPQLLWTIKAIRQSKGCTEGDCFWVRSPSVPCQRDA
jgi:hypothetical protein